MEQVIPQLMKLIKIQTIPTPVPAQVQAQVQALVQVQAQVQIQAQSILVNRKDLVQARRRIQDMMTLRMFIERTLHI